MQNEVVIVVIQDPTISLGDAVAARIGSERLVEQMEDKVMFTYGFVRSEYVVNAVQGEPITLLWNKCGDFVSFLKTAEPFLNQGYLVILTNAEISEEEVEANLNETPTEPPVKVEKAVSMSNVVMADYWNLRSAIRNGFLRLGKYKLADTAEIFQELLATEDTFQATRNFERLLTELARQAYVEGCRETGEKQEERYKGYQAQIAELEAKLKTANSAIIEKDNALREMASIIERSLRATRRTMGGELHSGGLLRPASNPEPLRKGEEIIPLARYKPSGFA